MASDDITSANGGADPWESFAHAMGIAALNATAQQQQIAVTAQSGTTMGVATLYAIDTASIGVGTRKLLNK